ncbi:hypothetical protein GGD81_000120 [Rhodobium orientis]|uniref:BrnT family toxin n=1 Tax=Rhodobium orientis TaxID=34017 RepID=A0A327JV53_9HYPH|nr:BrnT family toxin [Rhodobium orientis]MBB4301105.1 hypothetical protein [Rhodobium orientis]MBK5949772.1 hypothetical protein [Rhodobium orientis]RAI30117.1 hypothetical protein CH339_00875 [Rhodobium orientis]
MRFLESQEFPEFEWNERKSESNLEKHGFDFDDAISVFEQPHLVDPCDFPDEERLLAIGLLEGVEIAVIYTIRNQNCRVISARRARKNERRAYHQAIRWLEGEGQDRLGTGQKPDR